MVRTVEEEALKKMVKEIIVRILQPNCVPIGVSNRHVHLTEDDFHQLFPNEPIIVKKYLKQPGEFAAEQTVTILGPKGKTERVRILGPFRSKSQVEVSMTDARVMGLKAPLRISGDLEGTPGVTLQSPYGELKLKEGLIVAKRHIHMAASDAKRLHLKAGDEVSVRINTDGRPLIFGNCIIRTNENMVTEMHIDTDEANAAGVGTADCAEIILE